MDQRMTLYLSEMKRSALMLDNDIDCPECSSSVVSLVGRFLCHCRTCDKWFCKPEKRDK